MCWARGVRGLSLATGPSTDAAARQICQISPYGHQKSEKTPIFLNWDNYDTALTTARNLMPRHTHKQVGTFASHLSRLAYELMVARLGYFAPYASVDYPWCFHMMHKGDVPGFGMVNC